MYRQMNGKKKVLSMAAYKNKAENTIFEIF